MKTLNWILAVLFALFAAVQYNDPDPFGWIAVYGAVAALCALGAMGRAPRWALLAVAIVVLIWMVTLAPGMLDWARMGFPTIVGSMKAEAPHVEVVREFLGLLVALLALLHLLRLAGRAAKG
ncbi:MAG: transmembrane 220 family protein [Flavobacteriales bacterium]|jgi:thiamine monophosphate kinase|nr:transmembrane 220 family protein [Flavobacteriales bacterium]